MRETIARKRKHKGRLNDEQRARIRKLNRERAKRMEREVARVLGANRTDRSGAGFMKADALLTLQSGRSLLIECKTSEFLNDSGPTIRVQTRDWFPKLQRDVQAMRSIGVIAGFLVIKYLYIADMFCLIPEDDMKIIAQEIGIEMPSDEPRLTLKQAAAHFVDLKTAETYASIELCTKQDMTRYALFYIVPLSRMKGWFTDYAERFDRKV